MAKSKIKHEREKCIGCMMCVNIDPKKWSIDEEDGKATLKGSIQDGDFWHGEIENREVTEECPVDIIKVNYD